MDINQIKEDILQFINSDEYTSMNKFSSRPFLPIWNFAFSFIAKLLKYTFCFVFNILIPIFSKNYLYHFISFKPCDFKNELHFENGLEPKKPRYADNGDGCADLIMKWFGLFKKRHFFWAGEPHNMNTIGLFCSFNNLITLSVKISQP